MVIHATQPNGKGIKCVLHDGEVSAIRVQGDNGWRRGAIADGELESLSDSTGALLSALDRYEFSYWARQFATVYEAVSDSCATSIEVAKTNGIGAYKVTAKSDGGVAVAYLNNRDVNYITVHDDGGSLRTLSYRHGELIDKARADTAQARQNYLTVHNIVTKLGIDIRPA